MTLTYVTATDLHKVNPFGSRHERAHHTCHRSTLYMRFREIISFVEMVNHMTEHITMLIHTNIPLNFIPESVFTLLLLTVTPFTDIVPKVAPFLTLLLNGAGWAPSYPRLISNDQLTVALERAQQVGRGRFACVGDISCDVEVTKLPVTVCPTQY